MEEGFSASFGTPEQEFEHYFALFKNYCEEDDFEFGKRAWNKLMLSHFIKFDEDAVRDEFFDIVARTFHSVTAQKYFIKAHVAYRRWKYYEGIEEKNTPRGTLM